MTILPNDYQSFKEDSIFGRYVTNSQIAKFFEEELSDFKTEIIGASVQNRNIQSITLGSGPTRILMWSQMHGNESTTTKAVLDVVNFLKRKDSVAKKVLSQCTIKIIPILNPDGAEIYTRINANKIDLNRDAQDRTQPESVILKHVYSDFRPHYCFNLHDQRTIFNVGKTEKPATLSFLAPAQDEERSVSASRGLSMQLIVAINKVLQKLIPGQIGRYDDSFNANCVGDAFQMLGTPTILFEAGHFPEDYQRERTREYVFYAILSGIDAISNNNVRVHTQSEYFEIPENGKLFFDILIKNVEIIKAGLNPKSSMGILFREELEDSTVKFVPNIEKIGELQEYYGHQVFNCLENDSIASLRQQSFWNLLKE